VDQIAGERVAAVELKDPGNATHDSSRGSRAIGCTEHRLGLGGRG
jgi:hypothetical protein